MNSTSFSALIWWLIPVVAVVSTIGYTIWVSKYKAKFDNETNRSMNEFAKFQNSFKPKK